MSFASRRPIVRTLTTRLALWHFLTLAAAVAIFAALAYRAFSNALYEHHDDELASQAADLVQRLSGHLLTEATIREAIAESTVGSRLVMVRDPHGELLYRDPILQPTEPTLGRHAALVHAATTGSTAPEFFTVTLSRSGDVRFICAPLAQSIAYVQIGDPLGDVQATLHAATVASVPLIPLVLFLSSAGGWMIARRALSPVRSITHTLEAIQASDLSRRVERQSNDAEIGGLASTINSLLDRLERAFASLRQFAGDVSHQIQTPLTVMKGSIDSAVQASDDSSTVLLRQLRSEVDDISAIVTDLRAFALADSPLRGADRVDFSALVDEGADILAALGELRGVVVHRDIQGGVVVLGEAVRLKQLVLNLGDNAVKYTPRGGHVTITLTSQQAEVILEIKDTGAGIAAEHLLRIFDRAYRVDRAGRSPGGTGLGLAIAKRIAEAHAGTIDVASVMNRGSTFTVRLPTSSRSAESPTRR